MVNTTQFRFDGGATWLNLLATRGQSFGARPVERLPEPDQAREWLTLAGYPNSNPVSESELALVVALREALRDLAMSSVEDVTAPSEASALVHRTARDPAILLLPTSAQAGDIPVATALASIAVQALVTLLGPDRQFLKECAEVDCRWVFLDVTGRRRWCPSPACATRGRVRAHRAGKATSN